MIPARASESVACPKLAPRGMITRVGAPWGWPAHAAVATHAAISATRVSTLSIEGLLEQNRRGERIDIALSAAGGLSQLLDCTQSRRRGKTFIIKTNRHGG